MDVRIRGQHGGLCPQDRATVGTQLHRMPQGDSAEYWERAPKPGERLAGNTSKSIRCIHRARRELFPPARLQDLKVRFKVFPRTAHGRNTQQHWIITQKYTVANKGKIHNGWRSVQNNETCKEARKQNRCWDQKSPRRREGRGPSKQDLHVNVFSSHCAEYHG